MSSSNSQYKILIESITLSLLHNMKESSLIKKEEWIDDARDIVSMLRERSVRNQDLCVEMIEGFYVEKESKDNFTDFETPAKEVAKIYFQNEYI